MCKYGCQEWGRHVYEKVTFADQNTGCMNKRIFNMVWLQMRQLSTIDQNDTEINTVWPSTMIKAHIVLICHPNMFSLNNATFSYIFEMSMIKLNFQEVLFHISSSLEFRIHTYIKTLILSRYRKIRNWFQGLFNIFVCLKKSTYIYKWQTFVFYVVSTYKKKSHKLRILSELY